MAGKVPIEAVPLSTLQRYHQLTLNTFGDNETIVDAIRRRPGFYGPNPIAFLSLLARRQTTTISDLEEALLNDRSVVRTGMYRASMFLVASEDFPVFFRAYKQMLFSSGMHKLETVGIDERKLVLYGQRLKATNFQLTKNMEEILDVIIQGREKRPTGDVARVICKKLCDHGVLVRTNWKGWKGNQYNFALMQNWFEDIYLTGDNPEVARAEVVRRYMRSYGPVKLEDIVWWTGFTELEVSRIVTSFGREVVKFPVPQLGQDYIALRENIDVLRKLTNKPTKIQFLPLWDAFPLGWKNRSRVVDEKFAPWVYDKRGNATSVVVEDGKVIGLWQFRDGKVLTFEFHLFEPYANRLNALRLEADIYARRLAELTGAKDVRLMERPLPQELSKRPVASFLWPLGKEPVQHFTWDAGAMDNPMDRRANRSNRSMFLKDRVSGSNTTASGPNTTAN